MLKYLLINLLSGWKWVHVWGGYHGSTHQYRSQAGGPGGAQDSM